MTDLEPMDATVEITGTVSAQGLLALVGEGGPVLLVDTGGEDVAHVALTLNPLQRAVLVARLRWWADALQEFDDELVDR